MPAIAYVVVDRHPGRRPLVSAIFPAFAISQLDKARRWADCCPGSSVHSVRSARVLEKINKTRRYT
jgi:hypothetical protein